MGPDAKSPPQRSTFETALARKERLATAALFWERAWPSLWPGIGFAGAFLVLALFDVPARLPGWLHLLLLLAAAGLTVASFVGPVRAFRLPDEAAARRRLEKVSALAHRPLTTLKDRLADGSEDAESAALWQIHQARMAAAAQRVKVGVPAAGLVSRDPYALRMALALLLLVGVIDAGDDWGSRIERSLTPHLGSSRTMAATTLDIWVTPPDYTGLPPLFLQRGMENSPIAVPTGSTILAQVQGGSAVPEIRIDKTATAFTRIDQRNYKGTVTVTAGSQLSVAQDGTSLGSWPISVIPDNPPAVVVGSAPEPTRNQALKLEYQAQDDYGVETVKAILRRPGRPASETVELDLPLPGLHLKEAKNASFNDLTAHPWAGLPVEMKFVATDAIGQTGESDTVSLTLPERVFHHPVAKAIIEQRKQLTLNPQDRDVVAETLSDLSRRPGLFGGDIVAFMALRTAQARLIRDPSDKAIAEVQQLLWETALRIEDGRTSSAQRDLRQVMQDLQDALARNAPDSEIERLTRELKEAMDRYLRAMAEQMQRQGPPQNMQPVDPSRMMSREDLQRMIDRARDMAKTGSREAAKDLLSRLQEMLENLRMAQPGQMQDGSQGQAMRQMQDLMRRQQQLLNRSFRQSRPGQQGQPQAGESGDDAAEQEALRRMLGDMMGQMGEQGGDIPQSLGRAERAMRGAADALNRSQPGQAIGPQTEALDQLQQAARDMANQMMGRQNGPGPNGEPDMNGPRQADRDPFGRQQPQDNQGQTDDGPMRLGNGRINNYSLEKAKEILDELRRRAGERSRPDVERDYIDRLLKQF